MTCITFPIVDNDKLYLVQRDFERAQNAASVIPTEGKIICMRHTDDYLIAMQDTGHIIMIRKLQSEADMTQIDVADYNFDKVYCDNKGYFFAVDKDRQLYHISLKNDMLNIMKFESHKIKVVDMTFEDTPYILTDDNRIFQLSMNVFTGQFKIIDVVNSYIPKSIPEHVRAIRLKFTNHRKYLFDDKGDIYISQYMNNVYEWILNKKVHNIVGSYISIFYDKLLVIDTLGRLIACSYDHPQILGIPFLKETSGIKNYYIAKDDTGRLHIASCITNPPDCYSFSLASSTN